MSENSNRNQTIKKLVNYQVVDKLFDWMAMIQKAKDSCSKFHTKFSFIHTNIEDKKTHQKAQSW